ncbi:hypothetical protein DFH08DRAFT_795772 [Mycena albidolilacea]|uniref:Uncharacterized protein n=1 Tax=Mycena albidolilacea TaxID=1033008 RepID=A0AAD7ATE9_9AGAR|nr:hypothetical protein DFH08DRAFT_795772 [Mycena albidolilacea]
MIGFKAWYAWHIPQFPMTPTERILSLLVESGFIYILLWVRGYNIKRGPTEALVTEGRVDVYRETPTKHLRANPTVGTWREMPIQTFNLNIAPAERSSPGVESVMKCGSEDRLPIIVKSKFKLTTWYLILVPALTDLRNLNTLALMSSPPDSGPTTLLEADAQLLKDFGPHIMQAVLGTITESILCSAYGIFFAIAMIIGDVVVVWHTWAIYQRRIWAILMPSTLLLVSFVFVIIDTACNAYDGPLPGREKVCPKSDLFGWAFSVGTNVACTALVGFKAWRHRRMMRELNLSGKAYRMSTTKILSILVDSGLVYGLLWLSQVIGYTNITQASPWYFISRILISMGTQITGMYPTFIIVILNFQRTLWEEEPSRLNGADTLPLSFKKPGPMDPFGTEDRVDLPRETVIEITRENLGSMVDRDANHDED